MKKMTGMDETVDEMMIIVAKETNYVLADLAKMEVIRFLRIVENVKKLMKAKSKAEEGGSKDETGPGPSGKGRARVKY